MALWMIMLAVGSAAAMAAEDNQSNTSNANVLGIKAKSVILIEAKTGQVLYEFNADIPRPPASMTKMMTEYIVLDRIAKKQLSWDQIVTASKEAASTPPDGSQIYIAEGDKHSIKDLYIAMAVGSANDATVALASWIGGSEQGFVQIMNDTAKELGLSTAHYTSSTGLSETTVISARDQAKLAAIILSKHPEFLDYSKIDKYKFRPQDKDPMVNWNWMLESNKDDKGLKKFAYTGVDGMKTGYIGKAGYCFTGTAVQGDLRLVSVVMGAETMESRFYETAKLFDYGFNTFEMKTVVAPKSVVESVKTVQIKKGAQKSVPVVTKTDISFLVPKGTEPNIKIVGSTMKAEKELVAPIEQGATVGTVKYELTDQAGKKIQKSVELITAEKVNKASWWRLMFRSIGGFFASLFHGIVNLF
jgi:D-alanyl-D-alanine carboxypeptidase (penicillin-binding protein 5/6)